MDSQTSNLEMNNKQDQELLQQQQSDTNNLAVQESDVISSKTDGSVPEQLESSKSVVKTESCEKPDQSETGEADTKDNQTNPPVTKKRTRAERKQDLMNKLEASGETFDPKRWRKKQKQKKQKTVREETDTDSTGDKSKVNSPKKTVTNKPNRGSRPNNNRGGGGSRWRESISRYNARGNFNDRNTFRNRNRGGFTNRSNFNDNNFRDNNFLNNSYCDDSFNNRDFVSYPLGNRGNFSDYNSFNPFSRNDQGSFSSGSFTSPPSLLDGITFPNSLLSFSNNDNFNNWQEPCQSSLNNRNAGPGDVWMRGAGPWDDPPPMRYSQVSNNQPPMRFSQESNNQPRMRYSQESNNRRSSYSGSSRKDYKRPKNDNPPRGRDSGGVDVEPHLKLSITFENYPVVRLSPKQVESLKEILIEKFEPLESGDFPVFAKHYEQGGVLKVFCANEETKDWLYKIVPTLSPFEGTNLIVGLEKDIVKKKPPPPIRVLFNVPKNLSKKEPDEIIEMLGKQNKSIDTTQWEVVRVNDKDPNAKVIIVSVNENSLKAIKDADCKMHIGLGLVNVLVLKKGYNQGR